MKRSIFMPVALWFALSTIGARAQYLVPTNGLVGRWSGDGNAMDTSPVGNHGSFSGSYVSGGPTGRAFHLGTAKVVIANNAAYNFRSYDGWSVGFWFNGNGSPINGGNGLFLGQDNGSGFRPKWFINYGSTVYVGVNDWFSFHVNDFNQERIFADSQSQPTLVGWNQLTVTIDNTNNGTVRFYLNARPIGTVAIGNYTLQTTAPLIFGEAEGFTFSGLMSEVVIYNRVLSTNEVTQLATIPPLTITNPPANVSVASGGAATFSVGVTGSPPINYQWSFNGINIAGATNSSLTLTNVSAVDTGVYRVGITNGFEGILSAPAILTTVDVRLFAGILVNGATGTNYTLRALPSLGATNWTTLTNAALSGNPFIYIDFTSFTNLMRFYQAYPTP